MTHELVRTIPPVARCETRPQSDMVDQMRADHRSDAAHAMTLSPFVGDLGERAGKTFVGAWPVVSINYLVDGGLHLAHHPALYLHSAECALGAALVSVGLSLLSRRHGVPGTASLTKVVDYGSPPSR